VTAWAGKDLRGGAEMQAWQLAKQLIGRGHDVEILTTCCRSFEDEWSLNSLRPGLAVEDGIPVRRFRVDRRDRNGFSRADHALVTTPKKSLRIGVNPVTDEDARLFAGEGIKSSALLDYLINSRGRYATFLFMQYLYGTTLQGLSLVAGQALLQPTLHDEAYAYIPQVADVFHRARGLLFISRGEFELAQRLYGPGIIPKSHVVGAGVEPLPEARPTAVRDFDPQNERFVVYVGRQEAAKNVDLLVQGFRAYRSRRPLSDFKLVLAGQHSRSIVNSSNGIINLGPVTDDEKELLLRGCRALAQPSINESYSRVMIEAWMHGRPVVVNGECLATAVPVRESGGGWTATTVDEWSRVFETIDGAVAASLDDLGKRGRSYADEFGDWGKVVVRYEQAMRLDEQYGAHDRGIAVAHVVSPDDRNSLEYAESVGGVLGITQGNGSSDALRLIHISAGAQPPDVPPAENDVVICHRPETSSGEANLTAAISRYASRDRRVLGSTGHARDFLRAEGWNDSDVAPIRIDPRQWDTAPDRSLIAALQDGRTNVLFAGELVEFDHLGELIEAFLHYLTLERHARLVLLGTGRLDLAVHDRLAREIESLRLNDDVVLTTALPLPQRLAVYRTSKLFWSMENRGNLGMHLLTAMWFDIPIVAYKNQTSAFFAEDSSIIFTSKDDLLAVAALAKIVTSDEALRESIVAGQRRQRERFSAEATDRAIAGYGSVNSTRLAKR
jgi:glycosyltransferase involved in cell wall biosynthesis